MNAQRYQRGFCFVLSVHRLNFFRVLFSNLNVRSFLQDLHLHLNKLKIRFFFGSERYRFVALARYSTKLITAMPVVFQRRHLYFTLDHLMDMLVRRMYVKERVREQAVHWLSLNSLDIVGDASKANNLVQHITGATMAHLKGNKCNKKHAGRTKYK